MKLKVVFAVVVMASMLLWSLKLYTADYGDARAGSTGIIWRAKPALDNREHFGERDHRPPPDRRRFLVKADEWGYLGRDVYLWLLDYGYAFSTALSVLLLPLLLTRWLRARQLPTPAASDPHPHDTVYRD